jgi:hypothetical protein
VVSEFAVIDTAILVSEVEIVELVRPVANVAARVGTVSTDVIVATAALAAGADIKASPDIPTADTATSAILRLRVFNICFLSKLTKETFSLVSRFIARADESNPTPHSGRGVETWFFGVRNNLFNNIVR